MSFGQLLRHHRTAAGFSQEHLAGLARLSVESIGALERGARRAPYRETVALLARALELDESDRAKLEAAADAARTRAPRNAPTDQTTESPRRLPIQTTPLIGRHREVADIVAMLQTHRLVTITGSGGVGKTRVAIEAASRMSSDARPGFCFVDLSQLGDGNLVAETIAATLGLTMDDPASVAALTHSLRSSQLLLVLDNCEHLIADVALLVSIVLQNCPDVTFLTASRERLAVHGEVVYRLPSLDLPVELPPDLESARRYDGIEFFVQRATAIDHLATFRDSDVADIWEICRRLDGIPLALELAAARVALLGPAALRLRLREGLALAGGRRDVPARQQTMRATIAWSYNLLEPDERRVLQRISLFAGGFTLPAAESVCGADDIAADAVADILSSLVDKSLVNVARTEPLQRFALLDSVRSFALEQLQNTGDVALFSERHAQWVAAFADWVDISRVGFPDYRLRMEVDPELENARAALTWALEAKSEAGALLAGRIVGGLRTIWLTSGRRSECRRWASAALERIDEGRHPKVVAPLLRALVQMADGAELFALAERATSVFERIDDRLGIALLQSHVSNMRRRRGCIDEADVAIEKAGAIFAKGDLPRLMPYTAVLRNRAALRLEQGRFEEARADLEEAITVLKSLGDDDALPLQPLRAELEFSTGHTGTAIGILEEAIGRGNERPTAYKRVLQEFYPTLAIYRMAAGERDAAYRAGREAIRWVAAQAGFESRLIAIYAMTLLAADRGQAPRAARLLGMLDAHTAQPAVDGEVAAGPVIRLCRALLDEMLGGALVPEELERLKAEGRSLSIDTAMAEAWQV